MFSRPRSVHCVFMSFMLTHCCEAFRAAFHVWKVLYKYYYGYTSDINKIQEMQKEAKKKGFNSAFIVAYRDGERISLQKALNSGSK